MVASERVISSWTSGQASVSSFRTTFVASGVGGTAVWCWTHESNGSGSVVEKSSDAVFHQINVIKETLGADVTDGCFHFPFLEGRVWLPSFRKPTVSLSALAQSSPPVRALLTTTEKVFNLWTHSGNKKHPRNEIVTFYCANNSQWWLDGVKASGNEPPKERRSSPTYGNPFVGTGLVDSGSFLAVGLQQRADQIFGLSRDVFPFGIREIVLAGSDALLHARGHCLTMIRIKRRVSAQPETQTPSSDHPFIIIGKGDCIFIRDPSNFLYQSFEFLLWDEVNQWIIG